MMTIFSSVFMAELGDKTQMATLCYTVCGDCNKMEVFLASSLALILSTFLAVFVGAAIGDIIPPHFMQMGAGLIFLIMGALFLRQGIRGTDAA